MNAQDFITNKLRKVHFRGNDEITSARHPAPREFTATPAPTHQPQSISEALVGPPSQHARIVT